MTGTLRVTPERLRNSAELFKGKGSEVTTVTTQMTELVVGLATDVWQGEASQSFIGKFKQLDDDIAKLIGMINEHSNDLIEMANTYTSSETESRDLTDSLEIDVIL